MQYWGKNYEFDQVQQNQIIDFANETSPLPAPNGGPYPTTDPTGGVFAVRIRITGHGPVCFFYNHAGGTSKPLQIKTFPDKDPNTQLEKGDSLIIAYEDKSPLVGLGLMLIPCSTGGWPVEFTVEAFAI